MSYDMIKNITTVFINYDNYVLLLKFKDALNYLK